MPNIGIWEILILLLVILLIFGPKRLPQIGRSLGSGMREFKDTITDQTKELKEATVDTPRNFKDGLNPFKDSPEEEKQVEAQAAETAQPPPASPAPQAEPVQVAPSPSEPAPQKPD